MFPATPTGAARRRRRRRRPGVGGACSSSSRPGAGGSDRAVPVSADASGGDGRERAAARPRRSPWTGTDVAAPTRSRSLLGLTLDDVEVRRRRRARRAAGAARPARGRPAGRRHRRRRRRRRRGRRADARRRRRRPPSSRRATRPCRAPSSTAAGDRGVDRRSPTRGRATALRPPRPARADAARRRSPRRARRPSTAPRSTCSAAASAPRSLRVDADHERRPQPPRRRRRRARPRRAGAGVRADRARAGGRRPNPALDVPRREPFSDDQLPHGVTNADVAYDGVADRCSPSAATCCPSTRPAEPRRRATRDRGRRRDARRRGVDGADMLFGADRRPRRPSTPIAGVDAIVRLGTDYLDLPRRGPPLTSTTDARRLDGRRPTTGTVAADGDGDD